MMKTLMTLFLLCLPFIVLGQEPNPRFFLKNAAELKAKYHFGSLFFSERITEEDISNRAINEQKGSFSKSVHLSNKSYGKSNSYENYLIVSINKLIEKNEVYSLHVVEKATGKTMNLYIRSNDKMSFGYSIGIADFHFKAGNYYFDFCKSRRKYRIKTKIDQQFLDFQNSPYLNQMISLDNIKSHQIQVNQLNRFLQKTNCK